MPADFSPALPAVITVTELNRSVRELLESGIPLLWVAGEISNLTRAASGHWYFSLKDKTAQVRCVMFRNRNAYLDWQPREGDQIEARALVSLYEARGDFQLTVESMRQAGMGSLFETFEKLKTKLQGEGLFDPARKRALPGHPRQIGIVTSPDAAALRDVLATLGRRMPGIPVVIYPTPVQGKGAAELIATAIRLAGERQECDVLLVCRGGGSMEDLWSFNEEVVARAIAASPMPVVSGVGHETDFTIADFVADVRAPTPTAAAELVSPDRQVQVQQVRLLRGRLLRQMQLQLSDHMQKLDYLARRLIHPGEKIRQRQGEIVHLQARLSSALERKLDQSRSVLQPFPARLSRAVSQQVVLRQNRLQSLGQSLLHLNPQHVLERGYSLVQLGDGTIVRSGRQLKAGDAVRLTFAEGVAEAVVTPRQEKLL